MSHSLDDALAEQALRTEQQEHQREHVGEPVLDAAAGEKLAEVLLAPVLIRTFDLAGGGIENWFAYVLALVFLLFRPQGLFGERIIERV